MRGQDSIQKEDFIGDVQLIFPDVFNGATSGLDDAKNDFQLTSKL